MSSVPHRSQRQMHRKATKRTKNRARMIGGAAISLALLSLYLFGASALWLIGLAALIAVIALRRLSRRAQAPGRQEAPTLTERPPRRGRPRRGLADPLPPIGRRRKAASEELNTLSMAKPAPAAQGAPSPWPGAVAEPVPTSRLGAAAQTGPSPRPGAVAQGRPSPRPAPLVALPAATPPTVLKGWPELPPPHYPNARSLLAGRVPGAVATPPEPAPVVLPPVAEPEEATLPEVLEPVLVTPPMLTLPMLSPAPQVLITPPPPPIPALPAPVGVLALPAPAEELVVEEIPVEAVVLESPVVEPPVELQVHAPVVEAPVAPLVTPPPAAPPLAPIVAVRVIRAPDLGLTPASSPAPVPAPVAPVAPAPQPAPVPPAPVPAPAPAPAVAATGATAYQLPSATMLPVPHRVAAATDDEHLERALLLEHTLKTFGVEARVVDFSPGPAVTRYELQPAPGVRVNKFTQLADDIALALAAQDIRIEAPIPGKSAVGIEVPNKERQMVPLREVLETPQFQDTPTKLAIALGKDNAGEPVIGDLARMPHLLIAGSTGSGKSVCMNTLICSLLFKAKPDEVKMLMIDPKMVELSIYNGIPHLVAPVITDVRKAAGYLKGAVKEMENRYELFAAAAVRNIQQYNRLVTADPGPDPEHPRQPLPYIVIFIDELADLMMVAPADVEDAICRLAQMARACGMHLVIATQSPRVDVITGLIKANVPSRIAFAVSSQVDSRVIMDAAGAERLLGRGDMLYHPGGQPKPVRAQGAFIDEGSVEELVRFVQRQGKPTFTAEEVAVEVESRRGSKSGDDAPSSAADAAFPQAVRVVIEHGQASVSILQRRLRCNYNKAVRLIDMMEERGFVGPHQGSKPREVLISLPQWREEFSTDEDGENLSADD